MEIIKNFIKKYWVYIGVGISIIIFAIILGATSGGIIKALFTSFLGVGAVALGVVNDKIKANDEQKTSNEETRANEQEKIDNTNYDDVDLNDDPIRKRKRGKNKQ